MNCPICQKKLSWWTAKRIEHLFMNHMSELNARISAAMKAFSEWEAETDA